MHRLRFGLIVVVAITLAACGSRRVTLQEKQLPRLNPTVYVFDANPKQTRIAIKAAFEKWEQEELLARRSRVWKGGGSSEDERGITMLLQLPPGDLLWRGDADALSKNLLKKAGNENDAYFHCGDSPLGKSQTYFKNGQALIYFADFHFHLADLGNSGTRVEVFTYDSNVNTGVDAGWSPVHGRSSIYAGVGRTTIEEYQFLSMIGQQLGVTNMPPLITPSPDSPVKELIISK
jgi:hypothetical protein